MGRKRGFCCPPAALLATVVAASLVAVTEIYLDTRNSTNSELSTTKFMRFGRSLLQLASLPPGSSSTQISPSSEGLFFAVAPADTLAVPTAAPAAAPMPPVSPLDFGSETPAPAPSESVVPMPMAFFPLDGKEVKSLLGDYTGSAIGATFQYDAEAGLEVLQCNAAVDSTVVLSNVPYGRSGSWAFSFWIKDNDTRITGVERVFSHSAATQNTIASLWGPNQVKLYFPGTATTSVTDPYGGILRAIVKDSNDLYNGESTVTYLDSNGAVSNLARTVPSSSPQPTNLADGHWHMITLTTHPEGGKGFQMYVDGNLTAHMDAGELYKGADNAQHAATGGDPMTMTSNIWLCSDPAVNVSGQGFDGKLLELAIWNRALSAQAIQSFYLRHFQNQQEAQNLPNATAESPTQATDRDQQMLENLLSIPDPVAYFPLSGGSLRSDSDYGAKNYTGRGYNISWIMDPQAGTVLSCSKNMDSTVILDSVPYGKSGQWTISIWFQPSPTGLVGNQFEYIYSHTNKEESYTTGWEANQIRLYFPQLGHPAFGVIRALVKDSSDNGTASNMQTFLDSDGLIGQLVRNTSTPQLQNGASLLQNGDWHMVVLTTLPGTAGFAMYVDGALVGELNATAVVRAGLMSLDGGNPMNLDGNIFLCGRSQADALRGYDGQLAELAIFDSTLSADQINALYNTGVGAPTSVVPAPSPAVVTNETAAAAPESEEVTSTDIGLWTINGKIICLLAPTQVLPVQDCADSEVCAGVSAAVIQAAKLPAGLTAGDVGVCTAPPSGGLLLPKASDVPPAREFFPLTHDLNSFPLALESGNASGATLAMGGPFGHSVRCSQANQAWIRLNAVPYTALGGFSVNLWFNALNVSGSILQYIFSQAVAAEVGANGSGPNQVQIFFPEAGHPAFGVLRTTVADSNDNSSIFTFLDSDGRINTNSRRQFEDPRASTKNPTMNQTLVSDGLWHMVTVTSQPNGTKGYRIFIDGELTGEMAGQNTYRDSNGTLLPVDGGDPLQVPSTITLCGRYDNDPLRHYDGHIAYLGLYDSPLKNDQVRKLYQAVSSVSGAPAPSPATSTMTNLTTKSGKPCAIPVESRWNLEWTNCVLLRGVRACPVASGQWEECANVTAPSPAPNGLMTQDGKKCTTPVDYHGAVATGCVTFAAAEGTALCWVDSAVNGTWNICAQGSEVSIHGIPTTAADSRVTAAQQSCVLPVVRQGEIVTDCIYLDGSMSCPDTSGDWTKCASRVDVQQPRVPLIVPPYYQPNGFFVTNRTTISGEVCRLPLILNGTIITNCAGNGGSFCFGMNSNNWLECSPAPQGSQQRVTLQEIGDSDQGFPAKGASGGFCIPSKAEASVGQANGCQQGLACIPLPVDEPVTSSGVVIVADVANVGYCSQQLLGWRMLIRAYRPVVNYQIPQPSHFFPLTGSDLSSVTLPTRDGQASNVSWISDPQFESVLNCSKAAGSRVQLGASNFTDSGAWSLSLWFKRQPGLMDIETNSSLGYIFSQSSSQDSGSDFTSPNQVQLYMPGAANPSYGVARSVVKDSRDDPSPHDPVQSTVYLDTDGQINSNGSKPLNMSNPNDGQWHMLTLSTQPYSFAGYRLFLDGQWVGELAGNSTPVGHDSTLQIGGGAPIHLDGPIHICGRADGDPSRVFDGSVAHLALFNAMFTDQQVLALYKSYTTGTDPEPGVSVLQAPAPAPAPAPQTGGVESVSALGGGQHTGPKSVSHAGAVAGGVLGGLVGLTLIGLLAFLYIRRRRRNRFVPFKDSPPIYSFEDTQMKPEMASQVEMSKAAPRIEKLDESGFKGTLPQMPATPFAEVPQERIPAAKASKWEEDSEDGQAAHELSKKDSAMVPAPDGKQSEELLSQWSLQQESSNAALLKRDA